MTQREYDKEIQLLKKLYVNDLKRFDEDIAERNYEKAMDRLDSKFIKQGK